MDDVNNSSHLLEEPSPDTKKVIPSPPVMKCSDSELLMDTTPPVSFSELDSAFIDASTSSEFSPSFFNQSKTFSEIYCSVPDVSANNYVSILAADSGIFENKSILDDSKNFIGFNNIEQSLNESSGIMNIDFKFEENYSNFKDNDFQDAIAFFSDPESFTVLENSGSKIPSKTLVARDSLYQKFDPFYVQPFNNHKEVRDYEEEKIQRRQVNVLISDDLQIKVKTEKLKEIDINALNEVEVSSSGMETKKSHVSNLRDLIPDVLKKSLCNTSLRESLENKLISFNFPVITVSRDSHLENENVCYLKTYTEEDMQKALKIQELALQGNFLRKQRDLKQAFLKREEELDAKFLVQKCLSSSLHFVLKEAVNLLNVLSDKEKMLKEKLDEVVKDKNELKKDLDIFVKDLQNVENTFTDFQKEFEQSTTMLKLHIRNENLMQQLHNMETHLDNKEKVYKLLQSKF